MTNFSSENPLSVTLYKPLAPNELQQLANSEEVVARFSKAELHLLKSLIAEVGSSRHPLLSLLQLAKQKAALAQTHAFAPEQHEGEKAKTEEAASTNRQEATNQSEVQESEHEIGQGEVGEDTLRGSAAASARKADRYRAIAHLFEELLLRQSVDWVASQANSFLTEIESQSSRNEIFLDNANSHFAVLVRKFRQTLEGTFLKHSSHPAERRALVQNLSQEVLTTKLETARARVLDAQSRIYEQTRRSLQQPTIESTEYFGSDTAACSAYIQGLELLADFLELAAPRFTAQVSTDTPLHSFKEHEPLPATPLANDPPEQV